LSVNISRPTSDRIRARSSTGMSAFHFSPRSRLKAVNALATTTLYADAPAYTLKGRPNAPTDATTDAGDPAAAAAASKASASGCRPSPNSDFICASVTSAPAATSRLPRPARPAPAHRPGDSPFSE
jgi:hypothetical protein